MTSNAPNTISWRNAEQKANFTPQPASVIENNSKEQFDGIQTIDNISQ